MKWMNALAFVAVVGLVSAAFAGDQEAPRAEQPKTADKVPDKAPDKAPAGVTGKIVKLPDGGVIVRTAEGKEVGLETSGKGATSVVVDGKEAKVADLKVDMNVVITFRTATTPMMIVATTK